MHGHRSLEHKRVVMHNGFWITSATAKQPCEKAKRIRYCSFASPKSQSSDLVKIIPFFSADERYLTKDMIVDEDRVRFE